MKLLLLLVFLGAAAAGDSDVTTVTNDVSAPISVDSTGAAQSTTGTETGEVPVELETEPEPSEEVHEKQSDERNALDLDAAEQVEKDQVEAEDLRPEGSSRYYSTLFDRGDDDDDGVYYRPVPPVIRTTQQPPVLLPVRPQIIPLPLQPPAPAAVPIPIHDPEPTPAGHPAPPHPPVPFQPVRDSKAYPDHEPKYGYAYGIKDPQSGINVDVGERRDGDRTEGEYSVLLPDGRTQVVTYYVDKHSGFQAKVKYYGVAKHPEPVAKPAAAREIQQHPPPLRKSSNYAKTYDYSGRGSTGGFSSGCRLPDPSPKPNNVHNSHTVRYYDDNHDDDDDNGFGGYGPRKYTTRRHFPGGYAFVNEDNAVCTCYHP